MSCEGDIFQVELTRIGTSDPLPQGKALIEVESNRVEGPASPMDITIRIDGKEVAKGHVPCTPSLYFTASEIFDIGQESFSPVADDYFDRAPFRFNGGVGKVYVKYLPSLLAARAE